MATIETSGNITDPILTQNGVSIIISSVVVTEEYNNPVFVIVPPTSTVNQTNGPKDPWIVNLLRITQQFTLRGYVADTDRAALRAMFKSGNLKDNPCTLSWDGIEGGAISGVIEKLTITRDGQSEEPEWGVDITFTRGAVR